MVAAFGRPGMDGCQWRASRYHPLMRYGICLPNFTDVASPDTIDAAAGFSAEERERIAGGGFYNQF